MTENDAQESEPLESDEVADAIRLGIKEARRAAGLTQDQVAEALGVGQPLISHWESIKIPNARNLIRLARVLNTTPDVLLRYALDLEQSRPDSGDRSP